MNKALRDQVMSLPAEEKVELAMELWDSIGRRTSCRRRRTSNWPKLERRLAELSKAILSRRYPCG